MRKVHGFFFCSRSGSRQMADFLVLGLAESVCCGHGIHQLVSLGWRRAAVETIDEVRHAQMGVGQPSCTPNTVQGGRVRPVYKRNVRGRLTFSFLVFVF